MNVCRNLSVLVIIFFSVAQFSFAQEITEENYLKVDKEIWAEYEENMKDVIEYYKIHPDKGDSLMVIAEKFRSASNQKNIIAAIKYASVPGGLDRLFILRVFIPKDTLRSVFKNLSEEMRNTPSGKRLLHHIESEQIEEGSRYYEIDAVDAKGRDFRLSSLKGKKILFLYGGLSCIGQEGRDYLNKIYNETSRDDFEIVTYCLSSNLDDLQKVQQVHSCNFFLVSDFLEDDSPVYILYGAQSTPTCFFISQEGIVEMKTIGLDKERINKLLKEN